MNVNDVTAELTKVCHRLLFEHPLVAYALVQLIRDANGLPQDLILLDTNSAWGKYCDMPKESNTDVSLKTSPLYAPILLERIAHTLQIGHPTQFEMYAPALGRWFVVFCDVVNVDDKVACIFTDITWNTTGLDVNVAHDDRYRALVLACSEWIARLSPDGRILYPIRTPWPLPYSEKMGQIWVDEIIPSLFRTRLSRAFRKGIANKRPIMGNVRVIHPDGSLHWLQCRAVPIMDKNGEIIEWFAVADDITERRQMEAALLDSEKRLSYLLRLTDKLRPLDTPDAILTTVCEYLANYFRTSFVCFCEWNLDDDCSHVRTCKQRQGTPNLQKNDSLMCYPYLAGRLRAGEIVAICDIDELTEMGADEKQLCRDANKRSILAIPILVDAKIVASLSVFEKVPRIWTQAEIAIVKETAERTWGTLERARIHSEVMHGRERQTYLLQLSDTLRKLDDPEDIVKTSLRMMREYLGTEHAVATVYTDDTCYTLWEGFGGSTGEYLQGTYQRSNYPMCQEILRSGRLLVFDDTFTTQLISREEARMFTNYNVRAHITAPIIINGELVASYSVNQSTPRAWTCSDRKLAQETAERTWMAVERAKTAAALRASENHALSLVKKLEKADRNKNRYLSMLSHELRNPLAAIMAGLNTLEMVDDNPQLNKVITSMTRQAEQLCKLVNDLLELTRITQNKLNLKKEQVNLNELLINTLTDIRPEFDAKRLRLKRLICSQPVYIDADPVRITQCIENILHNALKFTPSEGTVWVSLRQSEDEAVLSIKDNGIGIDPEILPELFSPFIQADQSLDRHENSGLGLGLFVVKSIVEQHKGRVKGHSAGLGQGSTFTLYLPVIQHQPVVVEAKSMPIARVKPHKVLLIEDNKDLVELLRSMFAMLGQEVYVANEGETGIVQAKRNQPDIIFCDIGLPGMSGYEVAQAIRKDPDIRDVYLVALTGYAGQADVELSKKYHFDQHLAKPVDMVILHRILTELPDRNSA
jgi:signal transduction histidine kinase/CheY-like chemotaxis protein/PAS domain-containing protein